MLETVQILTNMPLSTNRREDMLCYNEITRNKPFVLFTTRTNLHALCAAETVLMDGTFKSCPQFFSQIYGIHGVTNGYYMPLVFVLLGDKSQNSYVYLLNQLLAKCREFGLNFCPTVIVTDFEQSVISSIHTALPTSRHMCCRFHRAQAWWRKIQNVGLSTTFRDNGSNTAKWLKRFFGLSLLPADEVSDTFANDIMDDAPTTPGCVEFSDYVWEQYISEEASFTPYLWAAAPDISIRTTNGAESLHGHLNAQFYSAHPNIYVFVETLLRIQASTYITITSAKHGINNDRKSSEKTAQLISLYNDYRSGLIIRKRYLQLAAYRVISTSK
jgi:hypothetical protein